MNEFERRFIELAQNHKDLMAAAKAAAPNAIVRFFGYSASIDNDRGASLVAGTLYAKIIPIQADSTFFMGAINSAYLRLAAGVFVTPANGSLQITDAGSGDVLFSGATHAALAAGAVLRGVTGIPLLMPTPRLIPPGTNVLVEYTPFLDQRAFYLTLLGARVENV